MTNPNKRQVKITNLWRKGGTRVPEDCEELDEEIKQLEQKLKDKQKELFQAQRQSYKRNLAPKKTNFIAQFVRPEKIVAQNNIEHLERSIELMSMLTGMEVKSYVAEAHCVIVYHMQHKSENAVEHGLKINMKPEQNAVSKFSLPLGFNFNAVVEDFDNIMTAECLGSIRKALVAYYDRLEQYQSLKEYLSLEGQLFKLLDGTHMEVTFKILSDLDEEDEVYEMLLMLDYRVYDIRPKQYTLNSSNLPDSAAEVLREQCAIFKRQPLKQAFKECFVKGNGPYKFVHQVSAAAGDMPKPRRQKRARTTHYNPNNDDTFRPEDCSSSEEDEARQMDHYGRY